MLLCLPPALQEIIFQYVTAQARFLQALERRAVQAFAKKYIPDLFVLLTRPMRLGGALTCAPYSGAALRDASLTSKRVCVAVDVPIDLASRVDWPLPSRLRSVLPGPREMWTGGAIVGIGMKKCRGTYTELRDALTACIAHGAVRYVSMVDSRLPKHLPRALLEGPQLEALHHLGPPSQELLAKLCLFDALPAALCFHYNCACFLHWAGRHTTKACAVETLGDFILTPCGVKGWEAPAPPCPNIKRIGLSITTGRYKDRVHTWAPPRIAEDLLTTFPMLKTIGLNLEVSSSATTAACYKSYTYSSSSSRPAWRS